MSKYWILNKIDEIDSIDPDLARELRQAYDNGRLFGILSVTQVDELTGTVTGPEYIVKGIAQIGDFTF